MKVFLEIGVDGESIGRVIIKLYSDVELGSQRFRDLSIGKEGIRYRASKFIRLNEVRLFVTNAFLVIVFSRVM